MSDFVDNNSFPVGNSNPPSNAINHPDAADRNTLGQNTESIPAIPGDLDHPPFPATPRIPDGIVGQTGIPEGSFDVKQFVSLTSVADSVAESDPYVNPTTPEALTSVSTTRSSKSPSRSEIPPAKTIDEILQKLQGLGTEVDSVESSDPDREKVQIENRVMPQASPDANDATAHRPPALETPEPKISEQPTTVPNVEVLSAPAADSANPACVPLSNPSAQVLAPQASSNAVPIVEASENDGFREAVFDVRDFSDSSNGVITPIPGTHEVDPDYFEFNVVEKKPDSGASNPRKEPLTSSASMPMPAQLDPQTSLIPDHYSTKQAESDDQLFVANDGDVITINGDDGFGYIDLACFDVSQATFENQVIKIDAGDGTFFEIRHRSIPYALFNDGVEVDLTPDDAD